MPTIWAVCKDPGGTQNLLPLIPCLRQRGHQVRTFLHEGGKGASVLETAKEPFESASSAEVLIERFGYPDLLVTSMCSGGGIGRDLIALLKRATKPTSALQDFWGARIGTDFADQKYHPDLICVNDEVGAQIIRSVWGNDQSIVATGYPRLDTLANFDKKAAAKRGREFLGIKDELLIVFYPGQIWNAGRTLHQIANTLATLGGEYHLVVSKHGRMTEETVPDEVRIWETAKGLYPIQILTDFSRVNDVIASSAVVVGQYATSQVDAAMMGVPVISVLYPEYGAAEFQKETGGVMEEFPLVSLGCSAKAEGSAKLYHLLETVLIGHSLGLEEHQAKTFRLDGKNAERTTQAILGL